MIAADSSTIIAYFDNLTGADVELFDAALSAGEIVLPPPVLSEIFSDAQMPAQHAALVQQLPLLEIFDGYWFRVGRSRATVLAKKRRARLPDALIAQSCIDHDVPLIKRDGDFDHFAAYCGLKLA
ncbi:MAG: PIN domain-containing protein [Alphaproteobacteria bacterium]|nr:PIN domain-containing protein [Alphaproteobacteria bacterium]